MTTEVRVPPRLAPSLDTLEAQLWARAPHEMLDLCRVRLGQLLGRPLAPIHVAPAKASAVRDWPTATVFDDAERAVLDFCEQYAIDASGITDAHAARLRRHFDAPTLAALTTGIAFFDAVTRVANAQAS